MVDIRTIRGKDKTDAFAKARVEYGGNFVILTSKDVKVGGFLGLGMKTEHELRIMLNNSIYDRKNNSEEKNSYDSSTEDDDMHRTKLLSDRIEMKKHTTETIDASEMADRIVAVTKALKEASRERNANRTSSSSAMKNSLNSSSQSVHSDSLMMTAEMVLVVSTKNLLMKLWKAIIIHILLKKKRKIHLLER